METLLKKYFWVAKLAGAALVILFAASASVTMFGSRLLLGPAGESIDEDDEPGLLDDDDDEEESPAERQMRLLGAMTGNSDTTRSRKENLAKLLVSGNIFCPTCAPEPEESPDVSTMGGPVRPGEIKSKLPLMLLATMESDDPLYSMATILHTDTNTLAPYSPNDTVLAGVVVSRVERGRVVFRNGNQMEYIELGAPPPPATSAPAKPTVPPSAETASANSREIEGAAEAIQCDAEFTSCTVDKAFVETLLANPAQLTKQARIVPAVRDGQTKGYKFYGIRPGSLPKLLGIKNGDLVTEVNGHKLESLDQAMNLYTKLRRASHLSVSIERKGKAINKEIDIK